MPSNEEMVKTLAGFQADEERQQEVEVGQAPFLEREREESQTLYSDLAPTEAQELLTSAFSSTLEALEADPAHFFSEARLIRPLGSNGALVMSEGRKKLIEGSVPVLHPDGAGKIDLTLKSTAAGFQPVSPLVDLEIPIAAEEGISVGDEGLEIIQAGAEEDSVARPLDEMTVFYPEIQKDTDLLVAPTATGVELFDQLRSDESPEMLRFHLSLPEGAQLRQDANAAEIVAADGAKLATVPPPTAVDAQGTQVPVRMEIEGEVLVLHVERNPGEFAYPILVDPIIEEWYWENWYEGKNLQALTPSIWEWNTSEGANSSYVYADFKCIKYTCWGSGRGLYMETPSGYLPPSRWGHWIYRAPNSETYLGNAWVSPLWRDDHGNCPGSTYPQPYDYVGMWNGVGGVEWNRIAYNESTKNNNQGGADLQSWGRALMIGMGTSSGISIPCWRGIMAGGVLIWLEDWSRPDLTTSSTGQWMDNAPVRLNVSAYDAGLGVRRFRATAINTSGSTSEWWTDHSCTGLSLAPCPHIWNLGEGGQPQLNYYPSSLPEGINKLSITAFDAAEKPSFTTNEMTVRIDHSGPTIALTGSLTEQAVVGTERSFYTLAAVALDGDPKATQSEPSKVRSGVAKLELEVDGQVVEPFTPTCAGEPNCGAEQEIGIFASQMSPGQHTLKARAKDTYGHLTTKELKFTVTADKKPPSVVADGMPGAFSFVDSFGTLGTAGGQLKAPADVAIDAKGNPWVLDKGNNRIQQLNDKGEFVKAIGSLGSAAGKLNAPAGLAVDSGGNLWVADTGNNRVEEFNEKGEFVLAFGKDVNKTKVEAGGTEAERNVCTAASGNVCQAGTAGGAAGQLKAPQGIAATSGGNVWVADTGNSRILKFSPGGSLINTVSGEGSEPGKLKEPSSIAMGPDGSIWVADTGNNRVQQWSSSLAFLRQFGSEGTANGQFKRPAALDVDAAGIVWVGDQNNNRIQQFNETGTFLGRLGASGSGAGQFSFGAPFGLTVDAKANIWIADSGNNRVQKWSAPALVSGSVIGPVTVTATDQGWGTTQLVIKLVNETGQAETLDSVTGTCPTGACTMSETFSALDLSEKPAGMYILIAEAIDAAGNAGRTARRVTLSPDPPQLTLSGSLADADGEPLMTASGALSIKATEVSSASAGVRRISVEVDHQRVSSRTFNCTGGCQEVTTSYRYSAKRDGAERSIETAAAPVGATAKALNGISCVSVSDCMAVGSYKTSGGILKTLVERWNGTSWQVLTSPTPAGALESRLESVSCVSTSNCVAVGFYKTGSEAFSTLIQRWNGSAWSTVASPNTTGMGRNYLYGVSCSGATDCWAVGKSAYTAAEEAEGKQPAALIERWNGGEWTISTMTKPPIQLKAISCASAASCMAVSGTTDLIAARWNGTSWSRQTIPAPTGGSSVTLNDISCVSASSCTAVGHYVVNGHTRPLVENLSESFFWSVQGSPDPNGTIEEVTDSSLDAVSCASAEACTAVGTRSGALETQPLVEGWDGTDWALQPAAIPSGTNTAALTAVNCVGEFNCRSVGSKASTNALIAKEVPDQGSKTVNVEAVDKYGNAASRAIEVDVPEFSAGTPTCGQEASSVTPKAVVGTSEATSALQGSLPGAVAPSEATISEENGEEIDPSYSEPKPNLDSVGTPIEGETEIAPEGGFTLEGIACISPATLTSAATDAKVVNGDAALFANTAPETDTLLRPTATGVAMVQSLRGSSAPTSISWNVTLNQDESLVELPSGAVAITRAGSAGEATGETPEAMEPEGMRSDAVLNEAQLQLEARDYQLVKAESETTEEVIAVIPRPWVILKQGSIMPLKIEVEQDVAVPTEYTMTYEYPEFELNFTPEAVVAEATASSSGAIACPNGSPCGTFVVSEAVQYAKKWGKPERNPVYPNFGSENCTNFLSQIMAFGGIAYMRAYEAPNQEGSWWVRRYRRASDEDYLFEWADRWSLADKFPRHLWQYGLAVIDSSNQPAGWTAGNILAEDWYSDGRGNFNHVQFVSGTQTRNGVREPLIANSSKPDDANYSERPWLFVKERLEKSNPEGWDRVPLVPKFRFGIYGEKGAKKHDPANLYNSNGMFQG